MTVLQPLYYYITGTALRPLADGLALCAPEAYYPNCNIFCTINMGTLTSFSQKVCGPASGPAAARGPRPGPLMFSTTYLVPYVSLSPAVATYQCKDVPLGTKGTVLLSNDGTSGADCHLQLFIDGNDFLSLDAHHGEKFARDFAFPYRGDLSYTVQNNNWLDGTTCAVEIVGM